MGLANALGDPVVLVETIGHFATWEYVRGRGLSEDLVGRARDLQPWETGVPVLEHPEIQFARIHAARGNVTTAVEMITRKLDEARRRGEWATVPQLLGFLAFVEIERGNWEPALKLAAESRDLFRQTGQNRVDGEARVAELLVHAGRGHVELVVGIADEIDRLPGDSRTWMWCEAVAALAFVDLSRGQAAAALEQLGRLAVVLEDVVDKREPRGTV